MNNVYLFSISVLVFLIPIGLFFRVFLHTTGFRQYAKWGVLLTFNVFFLFGYAALAYEFATGTEIINTDQLYNYIMALGAVFVTIVAWLFNAIVDDYEEKMRIENERTEKTYQKALQKEKELVRMKDHFIFVAAHELRSPVTAIKWSLEGLESGDCVKNGVKADKDNFENLGLASKQLTDLINDLLDTSRIEYGTFKVTIDPFQVEEAIQDAINETKFVAREAAVTVSFTKPTEKIKKIIGDKKRTKEVVVNLITNAIKYNSKNGSIVVSVAMKDNDVLVQVKDTGIGISKADAEKLFKKFSRIERDETENVSGTGLGLFITEQIIDRMGGKIWVESEGRGKGSIFSFTLPTK